MALQAGSPVGRDGKSDKDTWQKVKVVSKLDLRLKRWVQEDDSCRGV